MADTYAIVNINDLSKVDFSQVGQTSADTVRKSHPKNHQLLPLPLQHYNKRPVANLVME